MYHHSDRKNRLFFIGYIPFQSIRFCIPKLPCGGRPCSRIISCLQCVSIASEAAVEGKKWLARYWQGVQEARHQQKKAEKFADAEKKWRERQRVATEKALLWQAEKDLLHLEREVKKACVQEECTEHAAAKKQASVQKATTNPWTHRATASRTVTHNSVVSDLVQLEVSLAFIYNISCNSLLSWIQLNLPPQTPPGHSPSHFQHPQPVSLTFRLLSNNLGLLMLQLGAHWCSLNVGNWEVDQ